MPSIGQLFDDIKASIGAVAGGTAQPTQQQVPGAGGPLPQGQQGQQAPPPTATNAGVAQAGGAQPAPQSGFNLSELLLPALMGIGAAMQRPRQAGKSTEIGMGLTAAIPAYLQMHQQAQENALKQAELANTKQYQQAELGQGQQKIAIDKQKTDYDTKPAGIDIAASLRSDPQWQKALFSPEIMKGMTKDEQLRAVDNASKLVRSDASLEEKAQARMDRAQQWQESLQARYDSLAQNRDLAQEKIDLAKKNGEDASTYRAEMADYKKRMGELDKEKLDAQKEALAAKTENNNIKNVQAARKEFDSHWWKNAGKKFEDVYDPETGKPKTSGGSTTATESTIEP